MKAAFIGISKNAMNIAYTIKEMSKNAKIPPVTVCGIYGTDIEATVNAAVFLNVKAYFSLNDLLGEADILFISANDNNLSIFADMLKENHVQNKILCHFSSSLDSDTLFCGYANTYASFYMPFAKETNKVQNLSDECIMVEGDGKQFDEFANALTSLGDAFKIADKSDKSLAILANHFATDFVMTVLDAAVRLYKFAGVYSPKSFADFFNRTVAGSAELEEGRTREFTTGRSPRADEISIRKTFSLLNTLNCSDLKDIYRVLETHTLNADKYSAEEKENLISLLKRLR